MGYAIDSKASGCRLDSDTQTDWRAHRFANSVYRSAKQRGFFTCDDVFKSLESDEKHCEYMNSPTLLNAVKRF